MLLKEVRDGRAGEEELVYWDELLANHGAEVMWKRREYVEYMNSAMTDYYEKISGTHLPLEVRYHATLPFPEEKHVLAEELRLALWARRRQDIMTTHTTHGIHREDIEVFREKKPFLSFASRGEVRTLLLALKLLELYYMKQTGGETPILLLDDVFSELDLGRQERLLAVVNDVQTIITVTHLDGIVHPEEKMHIIMLEEELGEQRG
jgi:DNA replication and repair protein RecF